MSTQTQELLRQQFDELTAKRKTIIEASTPLREQRDKIKNDALAAAAQVTAQIAEVEKDLSTINTDLGRLSRALGGRQMSEGTVTE